MLRVFYYHYYYYYYDDDDYHHYYCGMPAIGSSAEVVVSCGVTQ